MKLLNTILLGLAAAIALPSVADVAVPPIFSDGMLLQRNHDVPIYGTASAGEFVTVEFAGQKVEATADANGDWTAVLKPMDASSEPRDMVITGQNQLTIKNILVGDIWLASGQSNMEVRLPEAVNAREEIAKADYPTMRFFVVNAALSSTPKTSGAGQCTGLHKRRSIGILTCANTGRSPIPASGSASNGPSRGSAGCRTCARRRPSPAFPAGCTRKRRPK